MEENKDQKQFLMDLGKSAEEAVQRMRGFEENYYYFLQRSMQAVAWPRNFDFAEAAHRYANQDFGAALKLHASCRMLRISRMPLDYKPNMQRPA